MGKNKTQLRFFLGNIRRERKEGRKEQNKERATHVRTLSLERERERERERDKQIEEKKRKCCKYK